MLEYLGINLTDGKLQMSQNAIAITGGTLITITGMLIAMWFLRRKDKNEEKKEQEKRNIIESLLPEIWITAYDDCMLLPNHSARKNWLRMWLSKVDQDQLPKITMTAAMKFAEMIAQSPSDRDFSNAIDELKDYVTFPGEKETTKTVEKELDPYVLRQGAHASRYYDLPAFLRKGLNVKCEYGQSIKLALITVQPEKNNVS